MVFIQSCKKTKLDGELSVLVGKWKWKHTLLVDNKCSFLADTIVSHDPSMDGFQYEMEFLKKGKIEISQTGEKKKKYRLIQGEFEHNPNEISYLFYLDKEGSKGFYVTYYVENNKEYFNSNTLPLDVLNGFDGCRVEYSVFEKVE